MTIVPTFDNIHVHYTALHMGAPDDAVEAAVYAVGPNVTVCKAGDIVLVRHHSGSLIVPLTNLDWLVTEDQILALVIP